MQVKKPEENWVEDQKGRRKANIVDCISFVIYLPYRSYSTYEHIKYPCNMYVPNLSIHYSDVKFLCNLIYVQYNYT